MSRRLVLTRVTDTFLEAQEIGKLWAYQWPSCYDAAYSAPLERRDGRWEVTLTRWECE